VPPSSPVSRKAALTSTRCLLAVSQTQIGKATRITVLAWVGPQVGRSAIWSPDSTLRLKGFSGVLSLHGLCFFVSARHSSQMSALSDCSPLWNLPSIDKSLSRGSGNQQTDLNVDGPQRRLIRTDRPFPRHSRDVVLTRYVVQRQRLILPWTSGPFLLWLHRYSADWRFRSCQRMTSSSSSEAT
jgi:hypothetical protein